MAIQTHIVVKVTKKTIGCSFSSVLILFDDYCHYFKYDHGLFNDLGHGKLTYWLAQLEYPSVSVEQ